MLILTAGNKQQLIFMQRMSFDQPIYDEAEPKWRMKTPSAFFTGFFCH
jgi:hypothetical protein